MTKNWFRYVHLGDFFSNPSGHPEHAKMSFTFLLLAIRILYTNFEMTLYPLHFKGQFLKEG
jgi:hypothetical protein